jgi:hypothetical protein
MLVTFFDCELQENEDLNTEVLIILINIRVLKSFMKYMYNWMTSSTRSVRLSKSI